MTVLHMVIDGAIAAGELLALLFVPPVAAAEPVVADPLVAFEQPVLLHRLSTTVDVRLLGSLADVRVAQHVRNDGAANADLARALPAIDGHVDGLRVVRDGHAVELLSSEDAKTIPTAGHTRLTTDEAIADALQLAPGVDAVVEAVAARPLEGSGRIYRLALPVRIAVDAPRAMLFEQDDAWFLVVLPHRIGSAATLVLRPEYGAAETLALGPVDPGIAVVIPLSGCAQLDDLAAGVVELEIEDGMSTVWTTIATDRIDARVAVQAGTAE